MLKMLLSTPILLTSWKSPLVLPQTPKQVHPVWKKMSMLVIHLSGSSTKANHCQEMLLKSYQLRVGTGKRYDSHIVMFLKFCRERYIDLIEATTVMEIESLTKYFKTGVGYSSVNCAP